MILMAERPDSECMCSCDKCGAQWVSLKRKYSGDVPEYCPRCCEGGGVKTI